MLSPWLVVRTRRTSLPFLDNEVGVHKIWFNKLMVAMCSCQAVDFLAIDSQAGDLKQAQLSAMDMAADIDVEKILKLAGAADAKKLRKAMPDLEVLCATVQSTASALQQSAGDVGFAFAKATSTLMETRFATLTLAQSVNAIFMAAQALWRPLKENEERVDIVKATRVAITQMAEDIVLPPKLDFSMRELEKET